jgi:hypothetical protein
MGAAPLSPSFYLREGGSTMLIECLIKRDGPTVQHIGGQKFVFKPRPELTGGDEKANVCEVQKDEIVEYLINNANYRQYIIKEPAPAQKSRPRSINDELDKGSE